MEFSNSKRIRNRRIGESEIELFYGIFSRLCDDSNKGRVKVVVKGDDFGELSSADHSALDAMKLRRKPVSEVEFSYRSEDYSSSVSVSVSDEFSELFSCSLGMRLSVHSTDEQWFDATWKKMEDAIEAVPVTPLFSRFLNKWHGVVAFLLALSLSFCTIRIVFRVVVWAGYHFPEKFAIFVIIAWVLVGLYYHGLISGFICRNYPVVDLDLYKTRSEIRCRCSQLFWWFVGVIGSLTIATYWPFGGRTGEIDGKMSPTAVQTETNRTAATQGIQGQVGHDKGASQ